MAGNGLWLRKVLAGSSANLGTLTSSASHPDMANALLSDSPERSGSLPHSNQSYNHLAGGGNLTPAQVLATSCPSIAVEA